MVNTSAFVREILRENGLDYPTREVIKRVKEKYHYTVSADLVKHVKARVRAKGLPAQYSPNDSTVSGRGDNASNNEGVVLSETASNGSRDFSNSNAGDSTGGPNLDSPQTGGAQSLEDLPQDRLKIDVEAAPVPPEAEDLAKQYEQRSLEELGPRTPESGQKTPTPAGQKTVGGALPVIETEEEIDAKLLGDSIVEFVDLGIMRVSPNEPLKESERNKGQKVISRVIQRRFPLMSAFGDIANLALWLLSVFPKRIFHIRPPPRYNLNSDNTTLHDSGEATAEDKEGDNNGSDQTQG